MHAPLNKRAYANAQDPQPEKTSTAIVATTFKQRDAWSRKIARDRRVKLMHRHVLRSLALCARVDGDGKLVIDPTYVELAEAAGCCKRTAMRAVTVAEENGIIRKARHSDGRVSNAFELLSNGDENVEKWPEKTQEIQRPTVTNFATSEGSNGDSTCHRLKVKRKGEEGRKNRKRPGPQAAPGAALVESQSVPLTPLTAAAALSQSQLLKPISAKPQARRQSGACAEIVLK